MNVSLPKHTLVSRKDRNRHGGGVAMFALDACASSATEVHRSSTADRCWCTVHCDVGPVLVACWYRPPNAGEVAFIRALEEEFAQLADDCVGSIVRGDMNVHHTHWLRFSPHVSPEGTILQN